MAIQLLASLPVMLLAAGLTHRLVREHEGQQREALQRRTDVTADTLARELEGARIALRGLLLSDPAQAGDVPGLRRVAGRYLAADSGLADVSALRRTDGKSLFSVSAASPRVPVPTPVHQPIWLPMEPSQSDRLHLLAPWPAAGADALLAVTVQRSVLTDVLKEQRWPTDWTVSVVDGRHRVLARSHDEARYLGQPVTSALRAHLQAHLEASPGDPLPGLLTARTLAGVPALHAVARIAATDWWVVVALPSAALDAMTHQPLRVLLIGGLAAGLLGSWAAFTLARSLRRQVAAAAAPPERDPQRTTPLRVHELQDIHHQRQHAIQALHDARHDALTGLALRALFFEQLAGLQRGSQVDPRCRVGVLYIDLDGFKALNDQAGHAEGDRLLAAFAQLLRDHLRGSDVLGRLGGDEFVAAMLAEPGDLRRSLGQVAHSLVTQTPKLGPGLGCSIGVAVAQPGESTDTLLMRADAAMRQAKRAGKGQVVDAPG